MDMARVEELFHRLADLPGDERGALLDAECAEDPRLRARLAAMLEHLDADHSLAPPPVDALPGGEGPGSVIGRYKLLQVIGEGGFGIVYMAEQTDPVRRKVALKVIKLGMDTREVVARFEAERQALALMDHPNIAKVLDGGATATGRPYFVMELVRGVSITEYCDTNGLDTRERLDLFMDVALAVQHAHQKGVIHRDIKPSNVMVTLADGVPVPKVIDFGIAKAMHTRLTEKTLFTEYQRFVGTPTYMSPEQAEMSALDVDTRTDIYSLGVLLYELLTGTTPVDPTTLRAAGFAEMQRVIRELRPPVPSQRISTTNDASVARRRAADVPALSRRVRGDLDWIVMRALEKERGRRYATANELVEDIRRHLRDEPVSAGPPSRVYRLRKFLARNRAGVLSGVVVLVSLVGGIVAATSFMLEANRQRAAAEIAQIESLQSAETARRAEALAQEQRALAQHEAEAALRVTDFLVETLSLADPSVVLDPDVSVRTLLDRASSRVARALPGQPEAEARVRDTMGHAYVALGEHELAEPHLRRAIALLDEAGGAPSMQLYKLLWTLTGVAFNIEAPDGWPLARRSRDVGHALVRRAHAGLADALDAFVASVEMRSVKADTDRLFRESLRLADLALPAGDPLWLIVSDSYMASHYTLWYSPDEAATEPWLLAVLDIRRRELPENHPGNSEALNQLVGIMTRDGRAAEAETLIRDSLQRLTAVHGEEGFPVAFGRAMLAENLVSQGRYDEAEPHARSSHEVIFARRGITNFFTIDSLNRLVGLYEGWQQPERAASFRELLAEGCARTSVVPEWPMTRRAFGPGLREVLDTLCEACGGVDYGARSAWRDEPDELPALAAVLGELRAEWDADPWLRRVVARLLVTWAGNLPAVPGGVRERMSRVALPILEAAADELPADLAECLALVASVEPDGETARGLVRRAHRMVRVAETLNTWITANTRTRVAAELAPLGLHAEARELLEESLETLDALFGRNSEDSDTTAKALAALYERLGETERARTLRAGG